MGFRILTLEIPVTFLFLDVILSVENHTCSFTSSDYFFIEIDSFFKCMDMYVWGGGVPE